MRERERQNTGSSLEPPVPALVKEARDLDPSLIVKMEKRERLRGISGRREGDIGVPVVRLLMGIWGEKGEGGEHEFTFEHVEFAVHLDKVISR